MAFPRRCPTPLLCSAFVLFACSSRTDPEVVGDTSVIPDSATMDTSDAFDLDALPIAPDARGAC